MTVIDRLLYVLFDIVVGVGAALLLLLVMR